MTPERLQRQRENRRRWVEANPERARELQRRANDQRRILGYDGVEASYPRGFDMDRQAFEGAYRAFWEPRP